jgi:Rieske Fe-S protein
VKPAPWTRRGFLAATGAATLGTCLTACGEDQGLDVLRRDLTLQLSDHPELETEGQSALIEAGLRAPIAVTLLGPGDYLVTGTECNHQGCPVERSGPGWGCTCHGARFLLDGQISRGPATKPLTRYQWTLDGDQLTILGQ